MGGGADVLAAVLPLASHSAKRKRAIGVTRQPAPRGSVPGRQWPVNRHEAARNRCWWFLTSRYTTVVAMVAQRWRATHFPEGCCDAMECCFGAGVGSWRADF